MLTMVNDHDIGVWLDEMLRENNMSRSDLAQKSGVSVAHISRIISGQRGVGLETLEAIAPAFGMTLKELLISSGILPEEDGYDLLSEEGRRLLAEMKYTNRKSAVEIIRVLHNAGSSDKEHQRQQRRSTAGKPDTP